MLQQTKLLVERFLSIVKLGVEMVKREGGCGAVPSPLVADFR